jgi:hypothetical protein
VTVALDVQGEILSEWVYVTYVYLIFSISSVSRKEHGEKCTGKLKVFGRPHKPFRGIELGKRPLGVGFHEGLLIYPVRI